MTAFFSKKSAALKKPVATKAEVSKKEVKKEKKETVTPPVSVSAVKVGGLDLAMILIRPHVTEKATDLSERGVYAFEINKFANKMHVYQAIEKQFKVKPVKIAMVNRRPKLMKNPRTGRIQTKQVGIKKALVFLKSGDKIEFV